MVKKEKLKEDQQEKEKVKSTQLLDSLLYGIELPSNEAEQNVGSYDYLMMLQQQFSESSQKADVELGPSDGMNKSLMTSEEH